MRIIIFAKAPIAGFAKTRLIPVLGAEGAAALARRMLLHACREAVASDVGPVELCLASHPDWSEAPPPGVEITDQGQGDLGERLSRAAERAGPPLLMIGTDCPDLDRHRLAAAAERLRHYDAVLFPAEDGGYALLGLSRIDRSLFDDIAWSTDAVARQTIDRIAALDWSLHIGETLRDIDEPADLAILGASLT
jgi:rSAM/selenodomain-associated transferase 1